MATRNRGKQSETAVTEAVEVVDRPIQKTENYQRPSEDPAVVAFRFFTYSVTTGEEGSPLFAGGGHQGEDATAIFAGIKARTIVSRVVGREKRMEIFYRNQSRSVATANLKEI